ncbi:lipid A-modifier LpxR family protein [Sulfitobacter aestuarii]|uniref:Lipid A-modifier LpxR family protein n=1 Tax=Sulfitobacter aestuarii TaxID=2161676 RepID=A0ABW5U389_9RHOB
MFRPIALALCVSLLGLTAAQADERSYLGGGRLISNDFLGDGKDRWRSGAISASHVWGPKWQGALPDRLGALWELRFGLDVLAPENLNEAAPGDRPYAGALSLGLHSHYQSGGLEFSLGGDLVATGPNTGLSNLHGEFHEVLGEGALSDATRADQIGNGLHPRLVIETGRDLALTDRLELRPFVEARAGVEDLVRTGFDLTFGNVTRNDLLIRDPGSGQRYRAVQNGDATGFSFVLGGDIAHVSDSIYLPEDRGLELNGHRDRLRAGLHWQGEGASAFYGLSWLGAEFEGQDEGQFIGSLRVNLRF